MGRGRWATCCPRPRREDQPRSLVRLFDPRLCTIPCRSPIASRRLFAPARPFIGEQTCGQISNVIFIISQFWEEFPRSILRKTGNNFLSHRLARDRSRSPPPQRPKDVFSLGCAHVAIAYPIESPQQRARNAAVIGSGYEPDDIVSMLSII
jgi:hypothetical protein